MFEYIERNAAIRNDFPVKGHGNTKFIYQQGIQAQFLVAPAFEELNRPQVITNFFWWKRKK